MFAVIAAHKRELRKLGVEYTDNERKADLVIVHALASTSRVDVFHSHGFYPTAQAGWHAGFTRANEQLIQTMLDARAVVSVQDLLGMTDLVAFTTDGQWAKYAFPTTKPKNQYWVRAIPA